MTELTANAVIAGHRIEALIGRGGMGAVYKATHIELGRPVALKVISAAFADDPGFRERFKRESRLAASIDHPNVIPVYQAGEADGALFITMRYVDGTDLGELIERGGRIEYMRAVHLLAQVAHALDAAHARGLVHRDVKPANILLAQNGQQEHVYLTDFGLTREMEGAQALTQTGQFVGTIDYAAPEQIEGKRTDARSDVYSLGCVLFHAVTGQRPYERDSDVAKLFAHLNDPPPSVTELLPSAPSIFDDVIRRALAKHPADRYQTAGELAEAAQAAAQRRAPTAEHGIVRAGTAPTAVRDAPAPPTVPPANSGSAAGSTAPGGGGAPPTAGSTVPGADRGSGRPRRGPSKAVIAAGAVAALVLVAIAAALLLSGGDDDSTATKGGDRAAAPAPTEAPAPSKGTGWRTIAPAPTARQQVPAATLNGAVWLLGGLTNHGSTDTVEGFDLVTKTWKTGPKLPAPLHHSMAVNYRDELVVLGGWIPEGSDPSAVTSKRVYVLRDGATWEELPPLRHARVAGAAGVVDGKIVVVGGQADGQLVRETEVFDGKAWRDGAPMPTPREHLGAAADREYLYAVGGRELSSDKNVAAFERYDAESDSWKELPDMPTARGGIAATVAGDHFVVAGGEEPTSVRATVESFDISAGRWAKLPDLPTARHGAGVASIGTRVFVVGGARRPGHFNAVRTAEAMNIPAAG